MSTALFLDLELNKRGHRLNDVGAVLGSTEYHEAGLRNMLPLIEQSHYIVGHNLIDHDLPFLKKRLGWQKFKDKIPVDTLGWSAILFANKPYHKLVKGYQLVSEDAPSDPLADAKLCRQLLKDEMGAFHALNADVQAAYHACLHNVDGYAGFFELAEYTHYGVPDLSEAILKAFSDKLCIHAPIAEFGKKDPAALAHTLGLISTTEEASIFPPWVLERYPITSEMLRALRFTPCGKSDCRYCSEQLDPVLYLQENFQHPSFRTYPGDEGMGMQERSVRCALKGGSLLTILPTGGGKSLTFQIPALMEGDLTRSLTLVISPLVSLMKDQVEGLQDKYEIQKAAFLSSLLSPLERDDVFEQLRTGGKHLLYVSPETLRNPRLNRLLKTRHIARIVIDEAHCFSTWGQDFRVDYMYIGSFVKRLQKEIGRAAPIPVSCFTATAKPQVIEDIRTYFKKELGLELEEFISPARRTNLEYKVIGVTDPDQKEKRLLELLQVCEKPAIIYASRVKRVERIHELLKERDLSVSYYHGQIKDKETKQANQNAFMEGDVDIMVATSAFGMGVDKEDVRTVIHYNIASSLENYVQEAGRAGRSPDIKAKCYILFHEEDLTKHFDLLRSSKLNHKQIEQVWRGVVRMTRFRKSVSRTAKEIAAAAGWDDELYDLETKVKTSIAALEDKGFVKRDLNSPRIFATGLQTSKLEQALRIVHGSKKLTKEQKTDCARILQRIIKDDETRIDYLGDTLDMRLKKVEETIQLLRGIDVLSDAKDLTAFVDTRPQAGSQARMAPILAIEKELIECLQKVEMTVTLRELNQHMLDADIKESSTQRILQILNFWASRKWIGKKRLDRQDMRYKLVRKIDMEKMREDCESRQLLARDCLNELFNILQKEKRPSKEEVLVEFSLIKLHETLNGGMFKRQVSMPDVEQALLFLNAIKLIQLEGGFLVYYQKLNIERKNSPNRRYSIPDHEKLQLHYDHKVQQIHIVGEYARLSIKDPVAAITFEKDYFEMEHDAFVKKYFKGRKRAIDRPVTEEQYEELFGDLDKAQKAIVEDRSKNILVAAGPGSGKTRVLVRKVASLILLEGIKPEQFLMLTFSKAASLEFRSRIYKIVPRQKGLLKITTFHGFCFELAGQVGDLESSEHIIDQAIELINSGDIDITSITNKSVLVLDEFQDVDDKQWRLINTIARKANNLRIVAVGDDDQNIFQFRNASSKYMQQFRKRFNAKEHSLLINHRSKRNLVELANELASNITERVKVDQPMKAKSEVDGSIRIVDYGAGYHLAGLVDALVKSEFEGTTTVLTRTNNEALMASTLLKERGIPARFVGGSSDFSLSKLREIRLFGSLLRKRHSTVGTIPTDIWREAKKEYLTRLAHNPHLNDCKEVLEKFEEQFAGNCDLNEWNSFVREIKVSDVIYPDGSTVLVSTMHKAKGKEFDNVFVFLDSGAIQNELETDDGKRLLYVACTRAKQNLEIHSNVPALHQLVRSKELFESASEVFEKPTQMEYLLSFNEIYLDAQRSTQELLKQLRTGEVLSPDTTNFPNNVAPGLAHMDNNVCIYSRKEFQLRRLPRFEREGYSIKNGQIHYIVNWFSEKDGKEIEVAIPRLTLIRNDS